MKSITRNRASSYISYRRISKIVYVKFFTQLFFSSQYHFFFLDGSVVDPDDQGISATVDSWEDNWLFQKKKVNRATGSNNYHHHPVPVPMLVPNPCEVTRPLIGDRDADETSELSDYSNSALDELLELCNYFCLDTFVFRNIREYDFYPFAQPISNRNRCGRKFRTPVRSPTG